MARKNVPQVREKYKMESLFSRAKRTVMLSYTVIDMLVAITEYYTHSTAQLSYLHYNIIGIQIRHILDFINKQNGFIYI